MLFIADIFWINRLALITNLNYNLFKITIYLFSIKIKEIIFNAKLLIFAVLIKYEDKYVNCKENRSIYQYIVPNPPGPNCGFFASSKSGSFPKRTISSRTESPFSNCKLNSPKNQKHKLIKFIITKPYILT
jgi:hypothetical protein